jgi:hypothetical protein
MSIAVSALEFAADRPLLIPLFTAATLVALADWLFYGWQVGISLALFLGVLGVVAVTGNRVRAPRRLQLIMAAIFVGGLLTLIEDVSRLSVIVGGLATALFVIVTTAREGASWRRYLFEAATTPLRGPFQLAGDLFTALRPMKTWTPGWLGALVAWIVPLTVFAVFLALFASANPLIEHQLNRIDLRFLFDHSDPRRIAFWILVACAIWSLIRRRAQREPVRVFELATAGGVERSEPGRLVGVQAVSRSLVLFNALFALQTGLDLTYLWGGANLPDGMSYAEYAHRGAYPLVATALLAAGFVLVAMRPGGPADQSRLIRPLVLVWTGQNIVLVLSSIFRLDLYVAAYSLTYLRLAAFIWMGLVAVGLLLMLIQIKLGKPNSWLVTANAISLALVLYGCCFVNAPQLVASYNVEHCREVGGTGPNLDLRYLASLGPQALPALEPHVKEVPALWTISSDLRSDYQARLRSAGWRAWSFRTWRLDQYLSNNPDTASNPSDSSKG